MFTSDHFKILLYLITFEFTAFQEQEIVDKEVCFCRDKDFVSQDSYHMVTDRAQCQPTSNSASDCFLKCPYGFICSKSAPSKVG